MKPAPWNPVSPVSAPPISNNPCSRPPIRPNSILTNEHLDKIDATYRAFETVEKYAYRATPQELADNDFNLNIPRYVDTFEEEKEIDLKAVKKEISTLEYQLTTVREKMNDHLKELGL